jgi:hypothetical protein
MQGTTENSMARLSSQLRALVLVLCFIEKVSFHAACPGGDCLRFEMQKGIGFRVLENRIRICEYEGLSVWRRLGRVARLGAFRLCEVHVVSSCAVGAIQQTVQYVVTT